MAKLENLDTWKVSMKLVKDIYLITNENKDLKSDYWLKDQMRRASISIPSNIAEWVWRQSKKEIQRFLIIARWSALELKTQVYLCQMLWYMKTERMRNIISRIESAIKLINWMIRWLNKTH